MVSGQWFLPPQPKSLKYDKSIVLVEIIFVGMSILSLSLWKAEIDVRLVATSVACFVPLGLMSHLSCVELSRYTDANTLICSNLHFAFPSVLRDWHQRLRFKLERCFGKCGGRSLLVICLLSPNNRAGRRVYGVSTLLSQKAIDYMAAIESKGRRIFGKSHKLWHESGQCPLPFGS